MTNTRLVTTTLLFPKEYVSRSPFSLQFLSLDRVRRDAQEIHLVEQFLAGVEELSFCSVLSLLDMHVVQFLLVPEQTSLRGLPLCTDKDSSGK